MVIYPRRTGCSQVVTEEGRRHVSEAQQKRADDRSHSSTSKVNMSEAQVTRTEYSRCSATVKANMTEAQQKRIDDCNHSSAAKVNMSEAQ